MVKRKSWIDCTKVIAMISVILCHVKGTIYTSDMVRAIGNFSVSLFVVLSGITVWYSLAKPDRKNPFICQFTRILKLFGAYALATFMYHIYHERDIVFKDYFKHLIDFDAVGPLYFLVFFFQLMLVAPILVHWIKFCKDKKRAILWHLVSVLAVAIIATLSIQFTSFRNYFGGSRYLFGGTYLILYYVGILFAAEGRFEVILKKKDKVLLAVLWLVWWILSGLDMLPFDSWAGNLWGEGVNPPSINIMIFTFITLFLSYAIFDVWSSNERKWIRHVVKAFEIIGRATLYIFLYHMLVLDILWDRVFYEESLLVRQLITIPALIIVPVVVQWMISFSVKLLRRVLFRNE